ncbi:MAG: hypothetical protein ISR90_01695 [Candidatus Marinimicrobia bacterium]|nr:hypothetical protein [Candidatus Neomarinimicrobiota bacterium]MBL7022758.1 hypothetical protein [Candidatus Neomarinimicrobiota bacterium]MBL7109721.1 hypothetical protein [Candidatus Neomarinimicrobiota bacterium]
MNKFLDLFIKLGSVDRRIIFVLIAVSVTVPLIVSVDKDVRITANSQAVFDTVQELPVNSKVLISFEYGPSTKPEIHPMSLGLVEHIFRNGHKICATALWPDGNFMSTETFNTIAPKLNKKYGIDYVNLGYKPGAEAVIKGIASDIATLYTKDLKDNVLGAIPMMKDIKNINDFDLVISLSAGFPGTMEWVQFACDPNDIPMCSGCTSVQVTEVLPYIENGQVNGVLAGMPGAAEYEQLIREEFTDMDRSSAMALKGMPAQSIAHIVIVLAIALGNITYFIQKNRKK